MDHTGPLIQEILAIGKEMNLHFKVNYGASWAGQTEHCIGFPPKKQPSKRKIQQSFFHVRPKEHTLCFAAHNTTKHKLSEEYGKYGLKFMDHPDAYVNPIPRNSVPLKVSLIQLDLDKAKHRDFIKSIIEARWKYHRSKYHRRRK